MTSPHNILCWPDGQSKEKLQSAEVFMIQNVVLSLTISCSETKTWPEQQKDQTSLNTLFKHN